VNAETPLLDPSECARFIVLWCEVAGAPHITLTAIVPDGSTTTTTFIVADTENAIAWITRHQGDGRNIYFQANETPARCSKKPTKAMMQAAVCRHADIDPDDGSHPFQEERQRLHRLAEFLRADPVMPPTVILDSGNGIQALWAIVRELLTPETIVRVENENRAIEAAVGAAGTYNVDRLLRLPGTLNFPNATKQKLGRGITRARILHSAPTTYSADDAALLSEHLAQRLAETNLVHTNEAPIQPLPKSGNDTGARAGRDRSRSAMRIGAETRRDGGPFEELVQRLRTDPETADWFKEKGERNGQREIHRIWQKTAPKPSKSGLPTIYNAAGRLSSIATEAERALLKSDVPLFQRGEMLVRPVVTDVPASHGRTTKAAGLKKIEYHGLLDMMAQTANWQRWDARSGSWADGDPSGPAANIVLSRAGLWTFPGIKGVITTPTLRADGTLLVEPGYDRATRLYHAKDVALDLSWLPTNPTQHDAMRALKLLNALLDEFPFVGAVDLSVALSGLITPVVRGAIAVAPLVAVRATTAGTGKSFLVDITSVIATGRICPVVSASKDPNETEKRLVGLLLAGYPIISLDNMNGELGGDLLCQAVERPLVLVRRLGGSDLFEIESHATLFATGNALRVLGDMTRRTLISTLDAQMERPELRTFQKKPVDEIILCCGRYVAACLTIVLAYQRAGCPDKMPPLVSFEDWSDHVRSALVWLGCTDPVASMETAREEDPELAELREVAGLWWKHLQLSEWTLRDVVVEAEKHKPTQVGGMTDFMLADLRDALLRVAGDRGGINTRRLAKWLLNHAGRIVTCSADPEAMQLRFKRGSDAHGGVARWRVEKAAR
jgi:hypothetical protein